MASDPAPASPAGATASSETSHISSSSSAAAVADSQEMSDAAKSSSMLEKTANAPLEEGEDALEWHLKHSDEYQEALQLKADGSKRFTASEMEEAIELYTNALSLLPEREEEPKEEETAEEDRTEAEPADFAPIPLSREVRDLRAQLHANIGTCHFKKERWKEAVASCTEALRDDPSYVKALTRRAAANEKLNTWSSLSSALEDWKTLYGLPDLPAANNAQAKAALARLPPLIDKRREAETAEVLGKLKDLGNSFLGKFGMSTDQFKFTPNGSGGYSLNMSNK